MALEDATIAQILQDESYVSVEDVTEAKEYLKSHGGSIVDYFFSKGLLTKALYGQALGEHFKVPFVDLAQEKIDNEVLVKVPELVARKKEVVAYAQDEHGVHLAMVDPSDTETVHVISKRFGARVVPKLVVEQDFKDALSQYKQDVHEIFDALIAVLGDKEQTRDARDEAIVSIVDALLNYGFENKASDIHCEPYEYVVTMRYRIDGVLHDVLEIPKDVYELVVSRIKIMSHMRTDEHRAAQDGKLRFEAGGEMVDVRVSIVPVTSGENIVMRLLSSQSRQHSLASLGLSERDMATLNEAILNPHGMILVTGPTGSGKTTSLYAVLKILNKREVNIATIEDPVEYDIEGISQIQVNEKTDLTFAKGLRALVRQDPDIIMVGEIRDEETAGIAVNSALTGHLVLSTLHTNDAATTLPRLLDMSVEPFLVASTVKIAIAQRLVRKICTTCRVSYQLSEEEQGIIKSNAHLLKLFESKGKASIEALRLYKGEGCKVCGNTGYQGRIGIFELLEMSEKIKELILERASSDDLAKHAVAEGMTTMLDDGVRKVISGETTLEEVFRAVGAGTAD